MCPLDSIQRHPMIFFYFRCHQHDKKYFKIKCAAKVGRYLPTNVRKLWRSQTIQVKPSEQMMVFARITIVIAKLRLGLGQPGTDRIEQNKPKTSSTRQRVEEKWWMAVVLCNRISINKSEQVTVAAAAMVIAEVQKSLEEVYVCVVVIHPIYLIFFFAIYF